MTIGLGFSCADGICLCADREITKEGGLKYREQKLSPILGTTNWAIAFTYSGDPDLFKIYIERVNGQFIRQSSWKIGDMRSVLQSVLSQMKKEYKKLSLETLCAASSGEDLALWITREERMRDGKHEYIGVGDSSVVRYLSTIFASLPLTAYQARSLSFYIASQATVYIEHVGGEIDSVIVLREGRLDGLSGTLHGGMIWKVETAIKDLLLSLTDTNKTDQEFEKEMHSFSDSLISLRKQWNKKTAFR